jgi:hypothetical protein
MVNFELRSAGTIQHYTFTIQHSSLRGKAGPGDPAAHRTDRLPLLPSGPGGVHRVQLHRAQPLTLHTSRFTSSVGGEGGIRTHGPIAGTHAFQACRFDHSRTSPHRFSRGGILTRSLMTGKLTTGAHRDSVDPPSAFLSHSTVPHSHYSLPVHIHSIHSGTRPILLPSFCDGIARAIAIQLHRCGAMPSFHLSAKPSFCTYFQ